jgi:hypothetical protein
MYSHLEEFYFGVCVCTVRTTIISRGVRYFLYFSLGSNSEKDHITSHQYFLNLQMDIIASFVVIHFLTFR